MVKYGFLFLANLVLYNLIVPEEKESSMSPITEPSLNVLGGELKSCCTDPLTGFYRDGYCKTGADDYGTHIICAEMTDAFLQYSASLGNDLLTARPEYHFPGLKAGDRWCLCVTRWMEALEAEVAPPVVLEATHAKALEYLDLEVWKSHEFRQP